MGRFRRVIPIKNENTLDQRVYKIAITFATLDQLDQSNQYKG